MHLLQDFRIFKCYVEIGCENVALLSFDFFYGQLWCKYQKHRKDLTKELRGLPDFNIKRHGPARELHLSFKKYISTL